MGAGKMKQLTAKLIRYGNENPDTQFVIICGTNEKLRRILTEKTAGDNSFTILGFTDRMHDYMAAADIFITKPGGLSSTEAAVSRVPIVHMSPIPGCETKNVKYFASHGMSLSLKKMKIEQALDKLKDREAYRSIVESQRRNISSAAGRICDLLENMANKKVS